MAPSTLHCSNRPSGVSANTAGGVVVVTHVHPIIQGAEHQLGTGCANHKFTKGRPLALGTVQIMIGLMVLLFGISMATAADSLGVFSGFFVWGTLLYISAGSLTVAAGQSVNRCLVNGSLALNVIAAVVSCTGVILYAVDAGGPLLRCYDSSCYQYRSRMQGVSGVLAVFNLLELIVSVTVAAYACNATCCCCTEQPSVIVVPANGSAATHNPPGSQAPFIIPTQLPSQVSSQMMSFSKYPEDPNASDLPPAYNAPPYLAHTD